MLCTVEDVKPGAVLYMVLAFPHRGFDETYIEELNVASEPFTNERTNSLFAKTQSPSFSPMFSLCDAGIVPNTYNFHKTFTTRESAKEYASRMGGMQLTDEERDKAISLKRLERMTQNALRMMR